MTVNLHSESLENPVPRFDYTNPGVTNDNVGIGLSRNGPFDSTTSRDFTDVEFSLVYPKEWRRLAESFGDKLINGHSPYFDPGFKKFYRLNSVSIGSKIELESTDLQSYIDAVDEIRAADDDIAIVFTCRDMQNMGFRSPYWAMKALLTQDGIPTQMVMKDKIDPFSKHHIDLENIIVNIANQMYAKLGGTPWVVHRPDTDIDLVIGVGKSEYQQGRVGGKRRTLGFASAYQSNGAFLWFDSTRATTSFDSFNEQLADSIVEAAEKYSRIENKPENIVVHSYKRIGRAERDAKQRIEREFDDTSVTLAHLNDSHDFRIYDSNDRTGLSERGLWIRTGSDKGFVVTGGKRQYRPGSPIPIELRVEGPVSVEEVAQGVFDLCSVYWKDQFGSNMPITINYAEDIADIVENAQKLDDAGVTSIDIDRMVHPRIKDTPWFL